MKKKIKQFLSLVPIIFSVAVIVYVVYQNHMNLRFINYTEEMISSSYENYGNSFSDAYGYPAKEIEAVIEKYDIGIETKHYNALCFRSYPKIENFTEKYSFHIKSVIRNEKAAAVVYDYEYFQNDNSGNQIAWLAGERVIYFFKGQRWYICDVIEQA
ncbi:hypothetical protein FACS189499_08570 [Clostridia bacterium]|nr:hypothetical protein FACS189499_08570 [Clostridia bacterium]